MCGGGAARVEEAEELGRWSRERPSPGPAAARRRRGRLARRSPSSHPWELKAM